MTEPRKAWAYRQLCAQVRAEEHVCWLCGRAIDVTLPARTRWSWSLDHVVPISCGGAPLDRANARAAHLACNAGRGNRPPARRQAPQVVTSRHW